MVFVVDSSDDDRLKECVEELTSLLTEEALQNVPLLIYANKQDLELALEPNEVMDSLKLQEIQGRMWNIQACSAITQDGKIKF